MNSEHLRNLIDRYYLGVATESEVAELDAALRKDDHARDIFIAAARLEANLYDEAINGGSAPNSGSETVAPRLLLRAIGAVAATVCLAILLFSLVGRRGPKPIATLATSENASWESELPTIPGSELSSGLLRLKSGIATLRFNSGAKVVLEAPAQLELVSPMRARLLDGTAVIEVPESAIGFIIETPDGFAVDYGTRFAVRVDSTEGRSDFELIEGEIGVHDSESDEEVRLTEPHKAATVSQGSIDVTDVGQDGLTETETAKVIRVSTNGRATTAPPKSLQHKFIDPEVLAVKNVGSGNGKWDYRSCFAFDLSQLTISNVSTARLRLNLVPSRLGFASRLPLVNRFEVYGLTNAAKSDWTVAGIRENAPTPDDGVLLGTFEIPRSQQRGTFGIDSAELLEFIKQHRDESVTFILIRETTQIKGEGRGLTHTFASDAHPEAVGPLLELTGD